MSLLESLSRNARYSCGLAGGFALRMKILIGFF
jgi:hypothetical protein